MEAITKLISDYGLLAMFLVILLEYACFPVSSEIVLPFSGAMASLKDIPYLLLLVLSVIAGLIGTTICYAIGRYGGNSIINKLSIKFPKMGKGLSSSTEKFNKFGKYAVCIGRVIPICRTYIAFIAGAAHQSLVTFIFSSLLGITVWNTVLIGFGYLLRENWLFVGFYYEKYKQIIIPVILIVILLLIYLWTTKKARKDLKNKTDDMSHSL